MIRAEIELSVYNSVMSVGIPVSYLYHIDTSSIVQGSVNWVSQHNPKRPPTAREIFEKGFEVMGTYGSTNSHSLFETVFMKFMIVDDELVEYIRYSVHGQLYWKEVQTRQVPPELLCGEKVGIIKSFWRRLVSWN